jgi:SAM-dependent methyltransferase
MTKTDSPLARQFISWRRGIGDELRFWRRWMETRGLEWPDDFHQRFAGGYDMSWLVAEVDCGIDRPAPVIVDIGSGPVTTFGLGGPPGRRARLHAVDPLAYQYAYLLDAHKLAPPVRTEFGIAEDLSSHFDRDYADIVYSNNALDHSFDPLRSIEEMLHVTRPTGLVFLRHRRNEAEHENYSGLHQWNFDIRNGAFIIRSREHTIDVQAYIGELASCESVLDGDFVLVRLRKLPHAGSRLNDMVTERRRARLSALYELLIDLAAAGDGASKAA